MHDFNLQDSNNRYMFRLSYQAVIFRNVKQENYRLQLYYYLFHISGNYSQMMATLRSLYM